MLQNEIRGPAVALVAIAAALTAAPVNAETVESVIRPKGPLGHLEGTFSTGGTKKSPLAFIIPASGPTDRDGNNPLGVKAANYKYLAVASSGGVWIVRGMVLSSRVAGHAPALEPKVPTLVGHGLPSEWVKRSG